MARARASIVAAANAGVCGSCADLSGQSAAVDKLKREIGKPVAFADLVNLDDVRMVKPGDGLSLFPEPVEVFRKRMRPGQDHLQGDKAVQPRLSSLVDNSHSATAEFTENLVPSHDREFTADRRHIAWRIASGHRRRFFARTRGRKHSGMCLVGRVEGASQTVVG